MEHINKQLIDLSSETTVDSLKVYMKTLAISEEMGVDELSLRSDKERYLMTVVFNYGLVVTIFEKLESDKFSQTIEGLVNNLHELILKEKDIKNKLFKTIDMNALDTIETCVWLSNQKIDEVLNAIILTATQVNSGYIGKKPNVLDTIVNRQIIKNGSRLQINDNIFLGLTRVLKDKDLKISNFMRGISRGYNQ